MIDDTFTFMHREGHRRLRSYLISPFFEHEEVEPSQEILTPIPLANEWRARADSNQELAQRRMVLAKEEARVNRALIRFCRIVAGEDFATPAPLPTKRK